VAGLCGTAFLDDEKKTGAVRFSAAQSFLIGSVQYKVSAVGICLLHKGF
jgi:hypothetical protein